MTPSNAFHFAGGAFVSAIIAVAMTSGARTQNQPQSFEEYERRMEQIPLLLDDSQAQPTKALMKRVMFAHHNRDAVAEVAELGDEYSFIRVYEDGPAVLAESREIAEEMSRNLYESDYMKNYQGVEAHPIAIVGNIGVQLDIERFAFEDGTTEVHKILTIMETKDGKLWRNWAFNPITSED